MKTTFKSLTYLFTSSLLLFSCSSSSNDDLNPQVMIPVPIEKITYDNHIKTIIDDNCLQCHGNPTLRGAPNSFVSYNQVRSSINNILNRLNSSSNPMPPSGQINITLRASVQQWKDDGLLEN